MFNFSSFLLSSAVLILSVYTDYSLAYPKSSNFALSNVLNLVDNVSSTDSSTAQPLTYFHQNWEAKYIVISYLVSVLGAQTALELINRRTGSTGLHNWLLLIGASLAMGGVGIFSMHFIGMVALNLHHPFEKTSKMYPIAYQFGFTFLSICSSWIGVGLAFYFVGTSERVIPSRIVASGLFAAAGICTMHYIAIVSMNTHVVYSPLIVAASVAIAIVAACASLFIFFTLRSKWKAAWWKRTICAMIMAVAVCGMHYTGMAAVNYKIQMDDMGPSMDNHLLKGPSVSTNLLVTLVACISSVVCVFLIAYSYFRYRAQARELSKRTKITLAVFYVDDEGALLVNSDGFVPTEEIVSEYQYRINEFEFHVSHSTFLWAYRAMRTLFVSSEGSVINRVLNLDGFTAEYDTIMSEKSGKEFEVNRFDERRNEHNFQVKFLNSVSSLSKTLKISPTELGMLYDRPIYPDTLHTVTRSSELSNGSGSEGVVLCVVRHISNDKVHHESHFPSLSYRWVQPNLIAGRLRKQTGINASELDRMTKDIKQYIRHTVHEQYPTHSHHASVLVVRTSLSGFQILVPSDRRATIPTVDIPIGMSYESINEFCKQYSNAGAMIEEHQQTSMPGSKPESDAFISSLRNLFPANDYIGHHPYLDKVIIQETPFQIPTSSEQRARFSSDSTISSEPRSGDSSVTVTGQMPISSLCSTIIFYHIFSATEVIAQPPIGYEFIDLKLFELMNAFYVWPVEAVAHFSRLVELEFISALSGKRRYSSMDSQEITAITQFETEPDLLLRNSVFEEESDKFSTLNSWFSRLPSVKSDTKNSYPLTDKTLVNMHERSWNTKRWLPKYLVSSNSTNVDSKRPDSATFSITERG
ncbi:hypothetical protein K7432_004714 [Basidiobolus ranarum]|uniref:MHYT domain-containing protein n=1 Tax=Basidiobolus ranarum TaxID=34480 RepID=A0ABR2W4L7_9FUNG